MGGLLAYRVPVTFLDQLSTIEHLFLKMSLITAIQGHYPKTRNQLSGSRLKCIQRYHTLRALEGQHGRASMLSEKSLLGRHSVRCSVAALTILLLGCATMVNVV